MRRMVTVLEKNGYEVMVYGEESGVEGINIIQSGNKYAPQITEKFGAVTLGETEFEIATTSYGGLPVKEINDFIAAYENAVEAVEYFKEKLIRIENATDEEYELLERFDGLVAMFADEGIKFDGFTQDEKFITVHLTAGLYEVSVEIISGKSGYFLATTDCYGTYTEEMKEQGRNHKYVKSLKGVRGYIERMSER